MVKLLFQPKVFPVAQTYLNECALHAWAKAHGYEHLIWDADDKPVATPLANIMDKAAQPSAKRTWLDTLAEFAGRFCYRSFARGRPSVEYLHNILQQEHGSVLEHSSVSFAISGVSRSLTHELIRHRAGTAVSEESQRYVDAKDVAFVVPPLLCKVIDGDEEHPILDDFKENCTNSLNAYVLWQSHFESMLKAMSGNGTITVDGTTLKKRKNEAARSMLPNCAETRLVFSANLRSWRHIVELRGSSGADLEIRRLAVEIARQLKEFAPLLFNDVSIVDDEDGFESVTVKYSKV